MKNINEHKIIAAVIIVLALIFIFINRNVLFMFGPQIVISSGTFQSGDNLSYILTEDGISPRDNSGICRALNPQYKLTNIKEGHIYEIYKTTYNSVVKFIYRPDSIVSYNIVRSTVTADKFICTREDLSLEKVVVKTSGTIHTSLWAAMQKEGFSSEFIYKFTDIFSWQIDFFNETQKGDSFRLVYEQNKHGKKIISEGKILAAEYNGKTAGKYAAVLFTYPNGQTDYFDLAGKSLRRLFLRAPLNFRRISSYFSLRRMHPILRYLRPHLGIDYSAASGTPVVSIGNGRVTYAGWKGGFGRFLTIRHNSTYITQYGHLLRFAKGIKTGKSVNQGQVIGYVGSTGMSTGPHLDFRITQNGRYVNFLKIKMPTSYNISKKYSILFEEQKREMLKLLD